MEGVKLLKDDIAFIKRQLNKIPKTQQTAVMRRYIEIWVNVLHNSENAVKAQNEGRRKANIWIREQAGNYIDSW